MSCRKRQISLPSTALIIALISVSCEASASTFAELLDKAEQAWSDLEYEQVILVSSEALQRTDVVKADRVQALRLMASAQAALGRNEKAGKTFEALLDLDPSYSFPSNTSPRILSVFQPARARWQVRRESALAMELGPAWTQLSLILKLPPEGKGGRDLPIHLEVTDPKRIIDNFVVHHRRRGARAYSRLTRRANSKEALTLPGALTSSDEAYVLEVFVEAVHKSGVSLRRSGSSEAPLSVAMSGGQVPQPESIVEQWWFWTGTALIAVAVPFLVLQTIDVGPQEVVGMRVP